MILSAVELWRTCREYVSRPYTVFICSLASTLCYLWGRKCQVSVRGQRRETLLSKCVFSFETATFRHITGRGRMLGSDIIIQYVLYCMLWIKHKHTAIFFVFFEAPTSHTNASPEPILLVLPALCIVFQVFSYPVVSLLSPSQEPTLVCSKAFSAFLHKHCPVVAERFSPTPWCWGGRLQTLVCALLKSRPPATYRK